MYRRTFVHKHSHITYCTCSTKYPKSLQTRTLNKFDFRPESSIWRFSDISSSALVKDFETRGRKCLLWHRVKFHGSCQKCHVATPSRECSACFMQFQGIWRTSARQGVFLKRNLFSCSNPNKHM